MEVKRKVIVPHLPTRPDLVLKTRVPAVNINPATAYGEVVVLYSDFIRYDEMQNVVDEVLVKLDREASEEDYVVCVGDPVLTAAVTSRMNELFGKVNFLRWDRGAHSYDIIQVAL